MNKLSVVEHHNRLNPSEIIRVNIDIDPPIAVLVQHLGSQKSIIVELWDIENDVRTRVGHFHYEGGV
jgi:hypothetical protein